MDFSDSLLEEVGKRPLSVAPQNPVKLYGIVAVVMLSTYWLQPNLGCVFIFDDVNLRWFKSIRRIKTKFIAFNKNSWHNGFLDVIGIIPYRIVVRTAVTPPTQLMAESLQLVCKLTREKWGETAVTK